MAIQAVAVGRPDEAVKLVHLGHAATVGSHPVSAATTSSLLCVSASAHAAQGDTRACDLALHQAEEHFANIDHQTRPPWSAHHDDADLANWQGGVYYALARPARDPIAANQAVALLRQAVDAVTTVHSPRAYNRLHRLYIVLEPLNTSPGVAELRERLTTTAT
jgi:hypothetical protein